MIELDQKKYLERRKQDLHVCTQALRIESFEAVESIGHKMKGNGTTFGFPELSAIGANLERSAKQKNKDLLEKGTNELKAWVEAQQSQQA